MKEFVDKLIERLEEVAELIRPVAWSRKIEVVETKAVIQIAKELAEEYNNDFCEWKLDGVYVHCQHNTELFISCLEEEKYRYNYCPICGKKIKVVE